jgi:hypothetical protein
VCVVYGILRLQADTEQAYKIWHILRQLQRQRTGPPNSRAAEGAQKRIDRMGGRSLRQLPAFTFKFKRDESLDSE